MTARRRFREIQDPLGGGRLLHARSRAGCDVWVAPLPGLARRHAIVAARFGSVDDRLADGTPLPPGTAHLLEHQMFQSEEGDLFAVYAARGAQANAFTTTTATSYLVSCLDRFDENLGTLLRGVRSLQTTPAALERERAIVAQEIALYDDDASWRGWFDLLACLYRAHPLRHDIAGTRQDIAAVDLDLLRRVHGEMYTPRNLVLAVAGDVEPAGVLAAADEFLTPGAGRAPRRADRREGPRLHGAARHLRLAVARPQVLMGWKLAAPGPGASLVRQRVETALLLDVLFGDGGRIQAPLFDQGLVDEGFAATHETEVDHAHVIVGGDVDDVAAVRRALPAAVAQAARAGLGDDEVERARRRWLGGRARRVGHAEPTANHLLGLGLDRLEPGAAARCALRATRRSLERRLAGLARAPRAVSVITPRRAR